MPYKKRKTPRSRNTYIYGLMTDLGLTFDYTVGHGVLLERVFTSLNADVNQCVVASILDAAAHFWRNLYDAARTYLLVVAIERE